MIDPGFEILNQRGTPMFFSDVFANRPTAGIVGRIFISTDTFAFYRDNGVTWDLIGGPGTGTITGSGTAFKYPVFTNTTEIGDGTIEQLSTKNQSTKDFEVKTSTDDGIYESELFLTNRFSGVDDTITFQYGRTISAGTPFLKISDNNALFPTSNLQYQGGQFGVYDSLLVVQNTIQNNIADFFAVEPVVRIGATGASNNAQLTFSASAGTYAGIIRLGNSGNVFQIRTFANVVALQVNDNTSVSISNLGGSGNQMVVVDNTGLLSKQAIPTIFGSLATGQVAFGSATNTIAGSNNLFWASGTNRLGINTNSPSDNLHVIGTGRFTQGLTSSITFQQNAHYFYNGGGVNDIFVSTLGNGAGSGNLAIVNSVVGARIAILASSSGRISLGNDTQTSATATNFVLHLSTGNISINSGSDNGLRLQVTGDGYFSGSVGIGSTSVSSSTLTLQKVLSGTNLIGIYNLGQIQSTNGNSSYYQSEASTSATAITVTNLRHFFATTSSFGAGSAVTNQFGFAVQSSMVGATNNYGFYGDIASGTGRWNLYMNGSARNFLQGNLTIGGAATDYGNLWNSIQIGSVGSSIAARPNDLEIYLVQNARHNNTNWIYQSNGTSSLFSIDLGNFRWFTAPSGVAGNTITYTERMRLYNATGNLAIGGTFASDTGELLQVNGTIKVTGNADFQNTGATNTFTIRSTFSNSYLNLSRADNSSQAFLQFRTASTTNWQIGNQTGGANLVILEAGVQRFIMNSGGAATFNTSVTVSSGSSTNGIFVNSGVSALTRLMRGTAVTLFTDNYNPFSPTSQDDTTISSWYIAFGGGSGADNFRIARSPAGSTTLSTLFTLTSTSLTLLDSIDIIVGTTNGTKIGTATTQKLAFWNTAPIVQPTTAVGSATFASPGAGTTIKTDDTFDGYTIQQVVKALRNLGLLA